MFFTILIILFLSSNFKRIKDTDKIISILINNNKANEISESDKYEFILQQIMKDIIDEDIIGTIIHRIKSSITSPTLL